MTRLKLVSLCAGQVLHEPKTVTEELYFPVTAIISTVFTMASGATAEIALTGYEGAVGVGFLLGNTRPLTSTRVQVAGTAFCGSARGLHGEFKLYGIFHQIMLCYTEIIISQASITAACNRHHRVEQQLCRWLLASGDRSQSDQFRMTQELVASMLGVRRQGVATAAARLRQRGLIRYHRGQITILNRPGLEAKACECYEILRNEQRRLMSPP